MANHSIGHFQIFIIDLPEGLYEYKIKRASPKRSIHETKPTVGRHNDHDPFACIYPGLLSGFIAFQQTAKTVSRQDAGCLVEPNRATHADLLCLRQIPDTQSHDNESQRRVPIFTGPVLVFLRRNTHGRSSTGQAVIRLTSLTLFDLCDVPDADPKPIWSSPTRTAREHSSF